MKYHIFHKAEDFWLQVEEYKKLGYIWIQESHFDYAPKVNQDDMPVVLNADDEKTMMWGRVDMYKHRYLQIPGFAKEFNKSLRKLKIKEINGRL